MGKQMKKVVNLFDLLLTRLDLVCWFQIVHSQFLVGLLNTAKKIKTESLPIWYGIPADAQIKASLS